MNPTAHAALEPLAVVDARLVRRGHRHVGARDSELANPRRGGILVRGLAAVTVHAVGVRLRAGERRELGVGLRLRDHPRPQRRDLGGGLPDG